MANLDALSADEQTILLWMAEAEVGVPDAPPEVVGRDPEHLHATIDRLVAHGLVYRELTLLDGDRPSRPTLQAALTAEGAHAVLECWRRRRTHGARQAP